MNPAQLFTSFRTIFFKETKRYMRLWRQTLLPPAITMVLYYTIFGNLIGPRIGEMGGFDYMQFIVPGLVMLSIITGSYSNVVSSFYGEKFQRSLQEVLVSPTPALIILLGFITSSCLRGIIVGILVLLLSLFFTKLQIYDFMTVIWVVALTSLLFACMGMINAIYAKSFDDVTVIPNFVLTPLTYLGGIFYSIDLLPPFWQKVSLLNPILYMVNAFRYGILGVTDIPLFFSFGIICVFAITLFVACWFMLIKGIGIRA